MAQARCESLSLQLSLPEVNGSVRVAAADKAWYRKFWSYAGLGFLISVGYSAFVLLSRPSALTYEGDFNGITFDLCLLRS